MSNQIELESIMLKHLTKSDLSYLREGEMRTHNIFHECNKCGKCLNITDFVRRKARVSGYDNICKSCKNKENAKLRAKRKAKATP